LGGTPDPAAGSSAPTSTLPNKFGLDKTQSINLENGTTYPINYKITDGQVTGMSLEPSLIVPEVSEAYKGKLLLEIPSVVLDPNKNSVVFDSGTPTEWKELARGPQAVVLEVDEVDR
jgi:hypothetical protein